MIFALYFTLFLKHVNLNAPGKISTMFLCPPDPVTSRVCARVGMHVGMEAEDSSQC